ncbi:MAG: glycine cleavage system protein GcvH [Kiritimatiellia bacterium]
MMDTPRNLKYTNSHEWVRVEGKEVVVGITDFAQDQLSDLTYVELPAVGDSFSAQEEAAVLESVKAASDIYAPVSGTVTAVNNELLDHPEVVNTDPYGQGWLFKLSLEDKTELEGLLDADEYDASMPDDE